MITPGGNPFCARCERWYGPGERHFCISLMTDDHDFDASDGRRPMIYRRNRIVATACTQCRLSSNACQAGQATRDGRPCCSGCDHGN